MFYQRFQVILADTIEARRKHFQLRYRVFCDEMKFEDANAFPRGEEVDPHDAASVHFLAWDNMTQSWAAAMRLVMGSATELPSEKICGPDPLLDIAENRRKSVEFSRLCILDKFRHVHSATLSSYAVIDGATGNINHPIFFRQEENEILLRLIRAMFGWAYDNNVEHCYFLINAALARVLKRLHIPLAVAGKSTEHRGKRTPYTFHIPSTDARMQGKMAVFSKMAQHSSDYVYYSEIAEDAMRSLAFSRGRGDKVVGGDEVVGGNIHNFPLLLGAKEDRQAPFSIKMVGSEAFGAAQP